MVCDTGRGPGRGPEQPGWSAHTLTSGGRERCYHLYIPPGLDPAEPAPVVVTLHGFVLNPDIQAAISGWQELADREGFVAAYAQGTLYPRRWNAGATWGAGAVDDVQFIRDLVDDLSTLAAVDRTRVYVNGFSNAGGMSVRVGCDAANAVVDMAACNLSCGRGLDNRRDTLYNGFSGAGDGSGSPLPGREGHLWLI